MRRHVHDAPWSYVQFEGYRVRITDGLNFYVQYKDEFVQRIYDFETHNPRPLIIDGGSNMGMSLLYFKRLYPGSRILSFEPDLQIFNLLKENVALNRLSGVELHNVGLADRDGELAFAADQSAGGRITDAAPSTTINVARLSTFITEPVDFLKLNIEGQELAVLGELDQSGKLGQVRETVVEYHGWAEGRQDLGELLNLLDRNGFRYLVHDFDAESCAATKPPFRYRPGHNWFCLIHGKRPQ